MNPKSKYIVISSADLPGLEWEESLQKSMGICHTFAKAYEIALFLAGITQPETNYRRSLAAVKSKGAVTIKQRDGAQAATIVKVRIY